MRRTQENVENREWGLDLVGQRISVHWEGDGAWFEGRVVDFKRRAPCEAVPSGRIHRVNYDDGDRKWHDLFAERWRRLPTPAGGAPRVAQSAGPSAAPDAQSGAHSLPGAGSKRGAAALARVKCAGKSTREDLELALALSLSMEASAAAPGDAPRPPKPKPPKPARSPPPLGGRR